MLVLTRQPTDAITIDRDIEVKILSVRGNRVQLGIVAPASVEIVRSELLLSPQPSAFEQSTEGPSQNTKKDGRTSSVAVRCQRPFVREQAFAG